MDQKSGGIIEKAVLDGNDLDRIEENIRKTEARIAGNLEELEKSLSMDSIFRTAIAGGTELFAETIKPLISDTGDAVKEMLEKSIGNFKRDPLPVLLMGAGAGLVLLSLYNLSAKERREVLNAGGETQSLDGGDLSEMTNRKSESSQAIPLALSALVVGAVVGGIIPGVDFDSPKLKQWKSDLLEKAGRAGQEILHSTEALVRDSFHFEDGGEKE